MGSMRVLAGLTVFLFLVLMVVWRYTRPSPLYDLRTPAPPPPPRPVPPLTVRDSLDLVEWELELQPGYRKENPS